MRQYLFQADALNILDEPPIKLRPPVTEKAESSAMTLGQAYVEGRDQRAGFLGAKFCKDVATLVADKAVAVEALAALCPDAICGNNRNDIRHRMADHRPPP